jgi:hypothetical protein
VLHSRQTAGEPRATDTPTCSKAAVLGSRVDVPAGSRVIFDVKPHLSAQDEEALHAVAQHGHAGHGLSA